MNCQYCDNPVPPGAIKCPSCGAAVQAAPATPVAPVAPAGAMPNNPAPQQQVQQPVAQKSVFLAQLLSCLIVGIGQMYNGQVAKGIVLLICAIALGSVTAGIASFVLWIIAIIDAGNIAKKINAGRQVGNWEFF